MSESKSRRWTTEELALLRKLASEPEPLSSVAAALGRTVMALRTKGAQERLTRRDDLRSPSPRRQLFPLKSDDAR